MLLLKNPKQLTLNNFYHTKEWWIFLSTFLFILLPLIFIWLFYGEFNFSNLNWLVAKNQRLWHGNIDHKNIDEIAKKFGDFYDGGSDTLKMELLHKIGKNCQILSNLMKINPLIFILCTILLIWSIVYPIVLYFFKISNIDVIPFSTTIGITGNGLIFSNLIPHYKYFFVLRVIIISVLLLVSFILSNYIINKIILIIATNNKQKRLLLCTYPNDEKKIYFNDLQKKIFFWKKHKQNDKAFVETKND